MFTLRETGERLNHRQAQNMLGISFPRDNPPPELEVYVPPVPDPPGPVPVRLGVLSVNTWTLLADSTDVATVTYTSNDTVHFVADGLLYSVEPVDSIATLEISADAPGPIPVQVQDKQIMLTAVEVPA